MWMNVRKTRVPVESALITRAPTPASAAPATRARSPGPSAEVRPLLGWGPCVLSEGFASKEFSGV